MHELARKFIIIIKKEPLTVLFLLIILSSLIWHETLRNKHFQECDSAGTYNSLYDFPHNALFFTALSSPKGHLISQSRAEKIFNNPLVNKIASKYFAKYPKQQIVERISEQSAVAIIHYGYIVAVSKLHLPHQIQGFFSLPLGSTYSAGPGLLYSLISGSNTSYEGFMSSVLFLNILIFHLCALGLYLLCKKIKLSNPAAIISSLCFLFSVSYYSSSYSTGSTLWNFASEILMLNLIAAFYLHKNFLKILSFSTAILVFFNYLVVFLWAAALLAILWPKLRSQQFTFKNLRAEGWTLIKSQSFAIILIFICGALFFVPGQSNRGSITWQSLPGYLYYIILNFFTFNTHGVLLKNIQFAFGLIISGLALYFILFKNVSVNPIQNIIKKILGWFVLIFCLLIIFKVLGLVPTRHILFLAPIWFIGLALALDNFKASWFKPWVGAILTIIISFAGFYSLKVRAKDVADRTAVISLDTDLTEAGVYDCSYNLVNKNWDSEVPVVFINPNQFQTGKTFLYLSQTTPFNTALKNWQLQYNISVEVVNQIEEINNVYFVAFNPDPAHLPYSRPNSLFETKFKIISISKK